MKSEESGLSNWSARVAATLFGAVCWAALSCVVARAEPVAEALQVDAETTIPLPVPEVATKPAPVISPDPTRVREVRCLAEAIYYEAKGEPRRGQEAVAEVVANRVASRAYPNTFCGVVYQRSRHVCQFSWACSGRRAPSGLQWQRANEIAEKVVDGWSPSVVEGATHFHAHFVSPSWSRTYRRVSSIGGHIFYKPKTR